MNKMTKRYYKVGETVWDVEQKKPMKVVSIDTSEMTVLIENPHNSSGEQFKKMLWEIDKYRTQNLNVKKDVLKFAKVREDAIIPSKRKEDAGYDVYSNIEPREVDGKTVYEQLLKKGEVSKVKTGIASAVSSKYALSLKHERSSVAKHGLVTVAGLVDSGYRGEIQLMLIPVVKDILITSEADEVEVYDDIILYPYTKAISQIVLLPVPDVKVEEVSYEELLKIESDRGKGGWGSSGK